METLTWTENISQVDDIEANAANTRTIDGLIDEFTSNTILKGEAWNAVRGKLSSYSNLLSSYSTYSNEFAIAISKALTLINDCVNGYSGDKMPAKITDFNAEFERIDQELKRIQADIDNYSGMLYTSAENNDESSDTTDNDNSENKVYHSEIQEEIDKLNAQKRDWIVYRSTIQELKLRYDNAKKAISEAYKNMASLNQQIDNNESSKIVDV